MTKNSNSNLFSYQGSSKEVDSSLINFIFLVLMEVRLRQLRIEKQ